MEEDWKRHTNEQEDEKELDVWLETKGGIGGLVWR